MIARLGIKKLSQHCIKKNVIHQTKGSIRHLASIQRLGLENPNMSQTVIHNGTVYISGQVDATASDIEGQTKDVLAKVDALLQEAGTDKSQLLTASIWVKDIENDFQGMNSVWNQWLDPDNKPVRATGEFFFRDFLLFSV
jgi:enamine deaminase RidA (YjgF/YER057c/UK114 family)